MPPTPIRPGHENCQDLRSLRILPYDPTDPHFSVFSCTPAVLGRNCDSDSDSDTQTDNAFAACTSYTTR